MATNDGGPAFPQHVLNPTKQTYGVASNTGMSLRDWLAGMALYGLLSRPGPFGDEMGEPCTTLDECVETGPAIAYRYADAMLRAKEAK